MVDEKVVDIQTIPLAELRQLATDEANKAVEAQAEVVDAVKPTTAKAQGEIDNSAEAAEDEAEVSGEPDRVIYRREIDLGGDSGIQVFQADTLEALVDKLAEAQRNATKKIREQAVELKKNEKPAERKFTENEEFILSQEMMTKPTEAFKKIFKETTGYDIATFKTKVEKVDAFESAQRSQQLQQDFLTTHPSYIANLANGTRIAKWCQTQGYAEFTQDGLNKAYEDLSASGLLELKTEEAESDTDTPVTDKRIAETVKEVQPQRTSQRKASGISTKSRVAAPVVKTEPTIDELYQMPLDKLRSLGNKAALANE